jgi:hypothetical protein
MVEENVQTHIAREAPEIEAYKLGLLELAKQRAAIPVDMSRLGYQTAGLTPMQRLAMTRTTQGLGSYQPYLNRATGALGSGVAAAGNIGQLGAEAAGVFRGAPQYGYGAAALADQRAADTMGGIGTLVGGLGAGAAMYDPNEAARFMDPYQREVTQQTLKDIDRQAQQDLMGIRAQGVAAGAFGGTRQAVAEQEFQRNISDIKSKRISEDMSRNYQQALAASMGAREQQLGRLQRGQQLGIQGLGMAGELGTQTALRGGQLGLTGMQQGGAGLMGVGGLYGQTADTLRGMGTAYGDLGARQAAMQQGENQFLGLLGGLDQETQQRAMDAYRQTATAEAYEPFQRIGFLSDMYKGAPSSESAITATTAPGANPMSAAVGTGIAALGAYQGYQNLFGNRT